MSNEELVKLIQQGTDPAGNMEQFYLQNKGLIYAVVKKYRYVDNLAFESIAKQFNIGRSAVRQMLVYCDRLIKRNACIRRLSIETGLWDADKPFSAERVKAWCDHGRYNYLDKKELRYARRMGWVDEELLQG